MSFPFPTKKFGDLDNITVVPGAGLIAVSDGTGASKNVTYDDFLAITQLLSEKNAANGYAGLDAGSLIAEAQIPVLPQSKITNLVTDLAARELLANKVTVVGTPGDDINYPTEKAVRDAINAIPTGGITSINADTTSAQLLVQQANKILIASDLLGNHVFTIGTDIVTLTDIQTLTQKTLTLPTIGDFTNSTHNHNNAAGGGQLVATSALTATGTKDSTTFLRGDDTWAVPGGAGDMILAAIQTVTGAKTYNDTTLLLRNVADTFNGSFVNNNTADRVYTLPNLAGTIALISDLTGFFDTAGSGMTSTGSTVNVIGTAGRITANANNIDISASYVGQATITTLGTITTGVWNGTAIALANIANGTANQIIKTNAGGTALEFGFIGDANTDTFTTTKISTISKSLLNTAIVYTDQANLFGDFAQTFKDNQLFIQNPADTFTYQIIASAIVANRTLTIPLLAVNSTFAVTDFANVWGTFNQNIAATGKWQEEGVDISPIGKHDLSFDAGGFESVNAEPKASRIIGTGDNRKPVVYVPFLTAVDSFAVVKFKFPETWNNGTITVVINWTTETEGSGNVLWGVSGVAVTDGDNLAAVATDYGLEVEVLDIQQTVNFSQDTDRTAVITLGNTPATGDMIYLKIQRLGADVTDTFTQTAQLLNVSVQPTTDKAVSP